MRTIKKILALVIFSLLSFVFLADAFATESIHAGLAANLVKGDASSADEGIRFSCDPVRLGYIKAGMRAYLASLGITSDMIVKRMDRTSGTLVFTLNTVNGDFDTLRLKDRKKFALRDRIVSLPANDGEMQKILTVSKKEILLALLQHGRLTEFSGDNCNLDALKEQVGIRQNIVAWSENLNWGWPDGEAAEWNTKYWQRGTPLPSTTLHAAFDDVFKSQGKYSIGCYTAAKIVMVQSILDYYRRIKNNPSQLKLVEARLTFDQDPLVDVEPGEMWSFEADFDPSKLARSGKILRIQYGVAPKNFVPGDWVYLLNSDPLSSQKTGYEGSNAIYLGRNKFVDYYNDNGHSYTYWQKLDEVYQWRNGVFSRSRDSAKIQHLPRENFEQLGKPPAEGGLVQDFRVFPQIFSHSEVRLP